MEGTWYFVLISIAMLYFFAASMMRDIRYAVAAPAGMRYVVTGTENLRPNPPGPV